MKEIKEKTKNTKQIKNKKKSMGYTLWEVLCKFAARYRIPRRRPDGRLKTEAQLEDDIYDHEQRRPTLREGLFFIEKNHGIIRERMEALREDPAPRPTHP